MKKRNSTELKSRMSGRWIAAFKALCPALDVAVENIGDNVPCPIEGGVDGFRLFKDANETGGGVKQSWRVIPEGIDMLMWVNNWSFVKAYDELNAWLGDSPHDTGPIYIPEPKAINEKSLRGWLNKIWLESIPLTDRDAYPARAYFGYRWIRPAAMLAEDLRYHRALKYKDKSGNTLGTFGAILTLVRNNAGVPVAIHRTFITKGGLKISLGKTQKPRKMTPSVNRKSIGRHIRLQQPMDGYLGVSEGLETALAVIQAKGFPVWPCLSNTMLQSFMPPPGVHTVLNFVDKDRTRTGENSAAILRANLSLKGIRVLDLLPPTPILQTDEKGVDWADQLKRDVSGFGLIDEALALGQLKQA
jgi:hypothetical protein